MQEQPVGRDPISVDYYTPLSYRLLILYLLIVGITSFVRLIEIVRFLWLSRPSLGSRTNQEDFWPQWRRCSNASQSMKRLVILTMLVTLLAAIFVFKTDLRWIILQKAYSGSPLFSAVFEALDVLIVGLIASAILYGVYALCEGALLRRMASWDRSREAKISVPVIEDKVSGKHS